MGRFIDEKMALCLAWCGSLRYFVHGSGSFSVRVAVCRSYNRGCSAVDGVSYSVLLAEIQYLRFCNNNLGRANL